MNKEQISVILDDHSKWLKNESEGQLKSRKQLNLPDWF